MLCTLLISRSIARKVDSTYLSYNLAADYFHMTITFYISILGVAPVLIFNQDGDQLDEQEYYNVVPGEYLECRPDVDLYPEFRAQFVWHRSIQAPSRNGPQQLSYQNTDEENNR